MVGYPLEIRTFLADCHPTIIVRSNILLSFTFLLLDLFFHSDTFYGQRRLSLKNNGKVHLHLIVQYEKIQSFLDPIRENIGRSRGTNNGRSLDEIIICRISNIFGRCDMFSDIFSSGQFLSLLFYHVRTIHHFSDPDNSTTSTADPNNRLSSICMSGIFKGNRGDNPYSYF